MQGFYYELTVTPKERVDFFSSLLLELSGSALEEKNSSLILRSEEELDTIEWAVKEAANKLGIEIETLLEKKDNEDWISKYKSSIQPVKVSSFYIRPEWEAKKENLIDIIINPALAFGSGHHESTSSCITLIDKIVKESNTVLDVGCGSGILGICASKKGAVVDICDTDELAVSSAKENFSLNKVTFNSSWSGSANSTSKTYDIVIANIIADIIIMINKDLKSRTKESGYLILSGIIDKYFDKVREKFSDFELIEDIHKGEWHTMLLKKI